MIINLTNEIIGSDENSIIKVLSNKYIIKAVLIRTK